MHRVPTERPASATFRPCHVWPVTYMWLRGRCAASYLARSPGYRLAPHPQWAVVQSSYTLGISTIVSVSPVGSHVPFSPTPDALTPLIMPSQGSPRGTSAEIGSGKTRHAPSSHGRQVKMRHALACQLTWVRPRQPAVLQLPAPPPGVQPRGPRGQRWTGLRCPDPTTPHRRGACPTR